MALVRWWSVKPFADRFQGSIVALSVADALGAPFEGGPLERSVWAFIGRSRGRRRWTDDTQMTLDLCRSLVAEGELDCNDAAQRFAQSYRWSRGYGPGTAKVLKQLRAGVPWNIANRKGFREGSFGNGGAMRVAPIALFFGIAGQQTIAQVCGLARRSASITHAHPIGQDGAACVAAATVAALHGEPPPSVLALASRQSGLPELRSRFETAKQLLARGQLEPATVAATVGRGIHAAESCVTAILIGASHLDRPLSDLLRLCRQTGGDVDTIGAMAGAIWGARNGLSAIPAELLEQVEDAQTICKAGLELFHAATSRREAGAV